MSPATEIVTPEPIATTDRCDRCGAQALVRARLRTGGDLLFCGHHWVDHEDALMAVAVEVFDTRDQ